MFAGQRISKYELLEFLGGGMASVYRARDTVLDRTIAIKILSLMGGGEPGIRSRFLHEARVLSKISHENIPAVYDFGEEGGTLYIVMEFLPGCTLRTAIKHNLLPDITAKLRVALQIARALRHIHQNQITHRDIKPENVHIGPCGHAKLMDFGISKKAGMILTNPGYALGTPGYMAPEQVLSQPINAAVDIYGFGILLYEMLLSKRPYEGQTIEDTFYRIVCEPLDIEPLRQAGVPTVMCDLIERCAQKKPLDRPNGFAVICMELEKAIVQATRPISPVKALRPAAQQVKRGVGTRGLSRSSFFGGALVALLVLALSSGPVLSFCLPPVECDRSVEMPVASRSGDPIRVKVDNLAPADRAAAGVEKSSISDVQPPPGLAVSPLRLDFVYQAGAITSPSAQVLRVTSNREKIPFVAGTNTAWLNVSRIGGATPASMNVALEPGRLTIGMNCGAITIRPVTTHESATSTPRLNVAVCVDVSARPFVPPPAASILPEPDLPIPPTIGYSPETSIPVAGSSMLAVPPPPPALAEHLHFAAHRPGIVSFDKGLIMFVETKGHRFEGPLSSVTVECHQTAASCLITMPRSSSGRRERVVVGLPVGTQLQGYLSRARGSVAPDRPIVSRREMLSPPPQ